MFEIDGINYDAYVVNKKYNVQESEEYGGFVDGWWTTHRMIARTRVMGKVVLAMNPTVYSTFIAALASGAGSEGEHTVKLLVQNLGVEKTITAFVYTSGKTAVSTPAFGSTIVYTNITLNIEER